MKSFSVLSSLLLAILTAAGLNGQAQQPDQHRTATTPSLGELARQLKSQREKAFVKPKTVFTNDNLPARPPEEGPTAAAGMASKAGEGAETKPQAGGGTATAVGHETETKAEATSSSEIHNEKFYRDKMQEHQSNLDLHRRELNVLQQKLAQNQMQYYPDPQKTLQQEFSRSDVNKLTQDVNKKKDEIAADEKAIEDLRDQLRREGGNSGWLR